MLRNASATTISICVVLEHRQSGRDIFGASDLDCGGVEPEPMRHFVKLAHLPRGAGIAWIGHDRQPVEIGDNLAQEFEPLAGRISCQGRQASDVPTRSREARDEAGADRVLRQHEHDRDNRRRLLCRDGSCGPPRNDDIDLEPDELGRNLAKPLAASLRPAIFNRDATSFDPTEFAQSLHKSGGQWALGRRCSRAQEPDARQLPRLLRARGERPRDCRAAECGQQFPPSDGDCHAPLPCEGA